MRKLSILIILTVLVVNQFTLHCKGNLSPRNMLSKHKNIYGVTIDDLQNLNEIKLSLKKLPVKPTSRIVFDRLTPAQDYINSLHEISDVSYIMGELADSYFMKDFSVSEHKKRVLDFVNTLDEYVDIWEIGNEINGQWLGPKEAVVRKMIDAYKIVEDFGGKTALTLYYNDGCNDNPEHGMFTWVNDNVPQSMRNGLDYVLVSYYEDDCNNRQPDWQQVFDSLRVLFPYSKLGIGECGTQDNNFKTEFMHRYYTMNITTQGYIGGYFWWYYKQDCVPDSKPLWSVLYKILSEMSQNEAIYWNNFAYLK